jgi:hypothetical protein
MEEHWSGQGSTWTRLNPPQKGVAFYPQTFSLEEDVRVKEMMMEHGIEKVRGGSYSNIHLLPEQTQNLQREIRHARNECLRCGSSEHWAEECSQQKLRDEEEEKKTSSPEAQTTSVRTKVCSRCSRSSHTEEECYALRDTQGNLLEPNITVKAYVTHPS